MKKKNLLFVALATLGLTSETIAQNLPNYVPANGLVGWWPFNGNANDESGNGNNGTVNDASLTTDRFGSINTAYLFDGVNDWIEIPNSSDILLSSGTTYSSWVNASDYRLASIIDRQSLNVNGGFRTCLRNTNPSPDFNTKVWATSGTYNQGSCTSISNNSYPINQWIHVVGTFNQVDGVNKIYVNGILEDSCSANNIIINGSGVNFFFGKRTDILSELFKGSLDDIGIWNRSLTQQEITDLYNGNICYQNITVTDTLLINMGITGFNPVTYNNTIKIFPNPANNHITIDYGNFATMNGYQLKIENSLGQQLFQTNITQQTDYLSLNNWGGNGLYFVHIIDAQGNTIDIRKIVLQ